ncbi:hypothetical protein [Saccharothrix sp. Mg75]|uniref:hypothetical protein n=1 Tax=Saccharothrix sp. Mg75 TaxID=3445357 RepID=UPI003EEFE47A
MRPSRLLRGVALVAGLVAAQAVVLSVAPAHASVPVTAVSANSASNSTATKTVTVDCPTGTFLYGAGGGTNGGSGNVALTAVVPEGAPPFRARVTATEVTAFAGNWNASAWASCASFTTNLQVVVTATASNAVSPKEAHASCPNGLGLYGTGFRVTGGTADVLVHDVIPGTSLAPRGSTTRATAQTGTAPTWRLESFGVCANPAPTMQVVQAQTTFTSTSSKGLSQTCPAGTAAQGVGAQALGENPGTAVDGRIALTTMANLFTTAGSAGAAENGAVAGNWRLQVYVICAN